MIYRFTIISDEVDDFVREIQIDPEATFYDFHEAILKSVGYTDDQMTSFFICDDDWEREKEVTLEEMDTESEIDSWVMKDTRINELVEDEHRPLLRVPQPPRDGLRAALEEVVGQDMDQLGGAGGVGIDVAGHVHPRLFRLPQPPEGVGD